MTAPPKKKTARKVTERGRPKQTAQRSTGGKAYLKDMTSASDDLVLSLQDQVPVVPQPRARSLGATADESNLVSITNTLSSFNC
jgi:hypothetical protein